MFISLLASFTCLVATQSFASSLAGHCSTALAPANLRSPEKFLPLPASRILSLRKVEGSPHVTWVASTENHGLHFFDHENNIIETLNGFQKFSTAEWDSTIVSSSADTHFAITTGGISSPVVINLRDARFVGRLDFKTQSPKRYERSPYKSPHFPRITTTFIKDDRILDISDIGEVNLWSFRAGIKNIGKSWLMTRVRGAHSKISSFITTHLHDPNSNGLWVTQNNGVAGFYEYSAFENKKGGALPRFEFDLPDHVKADAAIKSLAVDSATGSLWLAIEKYDNEPESVYDISRLPPRKYHFVRFDIETESLEHVFTATAHSAHIDAFSVWKGSVTVVTGHPEHNVIRYSSDGGLASKWVNSEHWPNPVHVVKMNQAANTLALGYESGTIALFDLRKGTPLTTVKPGTGSIHAIEFSAGNQELLVGGTEGRVTTISLARLFTD